MTPGIDSYVSLTEADEYIAGFYPDSPWLALTDSQKEQRLVLACERLEALPFSGRKTDTRQALSFPRFPGNLVPQSIRAAQIELATLDFKQSADDTQRSALQRQGVTAFSLGDLSETYGNKSAFISQHDFLADAKISGLLGRFLQGGYPIC